MMNIVIGYDGSDCAKAAIDDLRRCGLPREGTAIVVSACETLLPMPSVSDTLISDRAMSHRLAGTIVQAQAETTHAMREAKALAYEGCQRLQALFPEWEVIVEPMVGDPADAILKTADGWVTDLVVVGSHGRLSLGRFIVGSISKRVAFEARSSVLVTRQVVEPLDPATRVIIGVDGSRNAEAAVHAVAARFWPTGTEARVITVDRTAPMGPLPAAEAQVEPHISEQRRKAHAMVEHASSELLAAGLHVSTRIIINKGSPQDVLTTEARKWEADFIVVGARGVHGTRDGLRTGRVATALVMHPPCSIEVVRMRE